MNKVHGNKSDFSPLREERSRLVISYGYENYDSETATWKEIYIYKKQASHLGFAEIKKAILDDINARTAEKIVGGFVWNDKPVWLSEENQKNFSEAQRVADLTNGGNLPLTLKLGEDGNGEPVYHEFTTKADIKAFWVGCANYIQQCLTEGWAEKDGIDWTPYQPAAEAESEQ